MPGAGVSSQLGASHPAPFLSLLGVMTACGLDQNNQLWGQPRLARRAQPLRTELPESEVRMWVSEGLGPYAGVPGLDTISPEP